MFKKLIRGVQFRDICCKVGLNKAEIEIFTYFNEVTGGIEDNLEALKPLSFWGEFSLSLLCKIRPVMKNIQKLYYDEKFRLEWYIKYELFRDILIDFEIYPAL